MKDSFSAFALRYVLTLLVSIALLVSHRFVCGGLLAPFVPQTASAWELSKIAFWSLLVTSCLGGLTVPRLAQVCATTLVLIACNWAVIALGGSGGTCLVIWMGVLAAMLTWQPLSRAHKGGWLVAVFVLAALYITLTFHPLLWGPFLDPCDVAAMATIPY